jgi:hypothetical protein
MYLSWILFFRAFWSGDWNWIAAFKGERSVVFGLQVQDGLVSLHGKVIYLLVSHDRAVCPYAHNFQDFRRNPKLFHYTVSLSHSAWNMHSLAQGQDRINWGSGMSSQTKLHQKSRMAVEEVSSWTKEVAGRTERRVNWCDWSCRTGLKRCNKAKIQLFCKEWSS